MVRVSAINANGAGAAVRSLPATAVPAAQLQLRRALAWPCSTATSPGTSR